MQAADAQNGCMKIGFSLNEVLAVLTAVTGLLALAWRLRRHRRRGDGRPAWVAWGADFFGVIALVFGCRVALADWKHVPSESMVPAIQVGDLILINHLAYGPRLPFTNTALPMGRPQRGDVVVFRYPGDVSQYWVKRVIGLPGDPVEVPVPGCEQQVQAEGRCTVPEGHLLVLGDNRGNSADSRYFGFLPEEEVYGRADRVIFNFKELSRFWHPL